MAAKGSAAARLQETPYAAGSPLAGIDARIKITAAILWSVLLAGLQSIAVGLAALGGSLALILMAGWSWRNLAKRLMTVNFFILFMWLMLPFSFSSPGLAVASIGPLDVTQEGLELAVLLTVKANAIVIAVIALLGTSPLHVLAAAGRKMHFPEKLVNIFLLTVRYFYVMVNEYQRLRKAMRARGFKTGLNKHALNAAGNLVGSLLVRSFDRADRVHKAMLCRGYTGVIWVRTEFSLKKRDLVFGLMMLILLMAVGGYEWSRNV